MALPGDEDDVPRAGLVQGTADRHPAIELDHDPRVVAPAGYPAQHLRDDGSRILVARVVRRDEGDVAHARGDAAHQGALGPVPIPPAAEDAQDPTARRKGSSLAQHHLQPGRRVRVVDEHGEGRALPHAALCHASLLLPGFVGRLGRRHGDHLKPSGDR